ncbi:UNKNOWN [Stylonychia lemnae]|uniref:Uncharacterized protein n=1 Tax=Stylonychia lemnae TaxID=5949 RepID=A0A077ZWI6_STYLE|nr:UNKNOWN [Stylonychia lemnae]|eukprot:CDW73645.1 UNKNOWN [Stylonychia lemnae]
MKKRADEKFNILAQIGSYNLKLDILESMYFKSMHKKHHIQLWIHHPRPNQEPNLISTNEFHEVRTEKDIIRYFTIVCDKLRKKYKPLEDKRKVCLAIFKGNNIQTLSSVQLLDIIKHNLAQLQSLHFFRDNTQPVNIDSFFQYYMFALNLDEEKTAKDPPISLIQPLPYQKQLIIAMDKLKVSLDLVQMMLAVDVWDKTMRYKSYNYVSNLLYILEKKGQMIVERMNLYFLLDNAAQIFLFDLDKCLIQQPKKIKTHKDENHFIDGLKPEVSLLPQTFVEIVKTPLQLEEEAEKRKKLQKILAQTPKKENFILKNIKKLRFAALNQAGGTFDNTKNQNADPNRLQLQFNSNQGISSPMSNNSNNKQAFKSQSVAELKDYHSVNVELQNDEYQRDFRIQRPSSKYKSPTGGTYIKAKKFPQSLQEEQIDQYIGTYNEMGMPGEQGRQSVLQIGGPKIQLQNYFRERQLDKNLQFQKELIKNSQLKISNSIVQMHNYRLFSPQHQNHNHRRMHGASAIKREINRIKEYERVFNQSDMRSTEIVSDLPRDIKQNDKVIKDSIIQTSSTRQSHLVPYNIVEDTDIEKNFIYSTIA